MEIKITHEGTFIVYEGDERFETIEYITLWDRIKYRVTHDILQYLNCPVSLQWGVTLENVIWMLKKHPSFYKVFPKLKLLVEKYDEVKYKPSTKPKFKYIEFFRYIDTCDRDISKVLMSKGINIPYTPATIYGDMSIQYVDKSRSVETLSCTPGDHLENILNLPIKLNECDLPNKLGFTLNKFLSSLEYSLCYEFDQLIK